MFGGLRCVTHVLSPDFWFDLSRRDHIHCDHCIQVCQNHKEILCTLASWLQGKRFLFRLGSDCLLELLHAGEQAVSSENSTFCWGTSASQQPSEEDHFQPDFCVCTSLFMFCKSFRSNSFCLSNFIEMPSFLFLLKKVKRPAQFYSWVSSMSDWVVQWIEGSFCLSYHKVPLHSECFAILLFLPSLFTVTSSSCPSPWLPKITGYGSLNCYFHLCSEHRTTTNVTGSFVQPLSFGDDDGIYSPSMGHGNSLKLLWCVSFVFVSTLPRARDQTCINENWSRDASGKVAVVPLPAGQVSVHDTVSRRRGFRSGQRETQPSGKEAPTSTRNQAKKSWFAPVVLEMYEKSMWGFVGKHK